jgi:hypothetical protein
MNIKGTAVIDANSTFQGGTFGGFGTLKQLGNANFDQTTLLEVSTEFASGGTNTVAAIAELQLANDAEIKAGAIFQGDGILHNLAGSELILADGAEIGVALSNAGRLEVGASPGSATVQDFAQSASGMLALELGGVALEDFDQLIVDGAATLGGALSIDLIDSFIPDPLDSFTILTAMTLLGSFANVANGERLETVDGIGSFQVSYDGSSDRVSLFSFLAQYSADFDTDGDVDGNDLTKWELSFGADDMADADNDNDSDGKDFLFWQRQHGSGITSLTAAGTAVPETASGILLMLGMVVILTGSRMVVPKLNSA